MNTQTNITIIVQKYPVSSSLLNGFYIYELFASHVSYVVNNPNTPVTSNVNNVVNTTSHVCKRKPLLAG